MKHNQLDLTLLNLRKELKQLVENYSLCGLKGGTETEDMDFDEIRLLHSIGKEIVPVSVKIGGPEARNDIRYLQSIGVEGIVVPMIESEYSLRNFISTLKNMITPVQYDKLKRKLNLETITGYRNIIEIMDSKSFLDIHNVTAARSDLSASMDLKPDDPEVMRVTNQIVKATKERGKSSCVGGTITKFNFYDIVDKIQPDMINSRHIVVDVKKSIQVGIEMIPEMMLSFEIELYNAFGILRPDKAFYYKNRIELNRERIGKKKVLYSIR